jgi:hypothetical protein
MRFRKSRGLLRLTSANLPENSNNAYAVTRAHIFSLEQWQSRTWPVPIGWLSWQSGLCLGEARAPNTLAFQLSLGAFTAPAGAAGKIARRLSLDHRAFGQRGQDKIAGLECPTLMLPARKYKTLSCVAAKVRVANYPHFGMKLSVPWNRGQEIPAPVAG